MIVFLKTSDPFRVVELAPGRPARVVRSAPLALQFTLANTLRPAAIAEAREAAHLRGLKLRDIGRIAMRPEVSR